MRSGLAMTNTSETAADVFLEMTTLDGAATGLADSITIPASGQVARFIDQVFPSLTTPFSGILRNNVRRHGHRPRRPSTDTQRAKRNPHDDKPRPRTNLPRASSSDLFFPHFVDSDGWRTQFILFSQSVGAGFWRVFALHRPERGSSRSSGVFDFALNHILNTGSVKN